MKTRNMRNQNVLAEQFKDSSNLEIRKNFHRKYDPSPRAYAEWILSKIKFKNGSRVLEVGCGTGNLWEKQAELVETFSELILTDISKGMIDIAREMYTGKENVKAQVMDILDMPFEAESFDIVIANSMLYHVNDAAAAVQNIQRILRSEGVFCATTFGKGGQLNYINHAMYDLGLSDSDNIGSISFSLENGEDLLRKHFPVIELETYENRLEVTETSDLVDYIFSMASMSHIDPSNRTKMNAYFEKKKDSQGHLVIPTLYGMYLCSK
jgi:ubiquinone/menaquinone biosynthesis C-methylase UbiE